MDYALFPSSMMVDDFEHNRVHPIAITVMQEIGIDISDHQSKLIDDHFGKGIGNVVTVCDSAQKSCPFFPGALKK